MSKFYKGDTVEILYGSDKGAIGLVENVDVKKHGNSVRHIHRVRLNDDKVATLFENEIQIVKRYSPSKSEEYLTEIPISELKEIYYRGQKPITFKRNHDYGDVRIPVDKGITVVDRGVKPPEDYELSMNSWILNVQSFAGKGGSDTMKAAKALANVFKGTDASKWSHQKGDVLIGPKEQLDEADLHWFEYQGLGAVDRKIKDWYKEVQREEHDKWITEGVEIMESVYYFEGNERYFPMLTEDGIMFENGNVVTSGRVVRALREAKRLWETGDKKKFQDFVSPYLDTFSGDDGFVFVTTLITKYDSIKDILVDMAYDSVPRTTRPTKPSPRRKKQK